MQPEIREPNQSNSLVFSLVRKSAGLENHTSLWLVLSSLKSEAKSFHASLNMLRRSRKKNCAGALNFSFAVEVSTRTFVQWKKRTLRLSQVWQLCPLWLPEKFLFDPQNTNCYCCKCHWCKLNYRIEIIVPFGGRPPDQILAPSLVTTFSSRCSDISSPVKAFIFFNPGGVGIWCRFKFHRLFSCLVIKLKLWNWAEFDVFTLAKSWTTKVHN